MSNWLTNVTKRKDDDHWSAIENLSLEISDNNYWINLCNHLQPVGQTIIEMHLDTGLASVLNPLDCNDYYFLLDEILESLSFSQRKTLTRLIKNPSNEMLLLVSADGPELSRHWIKMRCTNGSTREGNKFVFLVLDNVSEAYTKDLYDRMFWF